MKMMLRWGWFLTVMAAGGALALLQLSALAYSGPSAQAVAPTEQPSATPSTAAAAAREWQGQVDLEVLFPPGEGRELVLTNCMSCHTFARLVLVPRDTAHWQVTEESHRVRFTRLSDEQYAWMFTYLKTNLNDVDLRQKLPGWVKDLW